MSPLGRQEGQALALTVLSLTVLLGLTALVVDVGAWFRESRRLQAVADAAALAGAQALPTDPAGAIAQAQAYGAKNGGVISPEDVTIRDGSSSRDTIDVRARAAAPGFFSRVLGVASFEISARSTAVSTPIGSARGAAPIAVPESHPLLQCQPDPCFDQSTTLSLINLNDPSSGGSGAFGLVNFDTSKAGTASATTVGKWIREGYQGYIEADPGYSDVEDYSSATGAKFNSADISNALNTKIGVDVLLPVYRSISGTGANARYDIVGWVGFRLESFSGSGSSGTLRGTFREVVWEGSEGTGDTVDFGARAVRLSA